MNDSSNLTVVSAPLVVPTLPDDATPAEAAHAYADVGIYVLPTDPNNSKNAGSILGTGWPRKTSRDHDVIDAWFNDFADLDVAWHCGRSGLAVPDVDTPDKVPNVLAIAINTWRPPFQATRPDEDPDRGHYIFGMPPGRWLGNSVGTLGAGWGDMRGANGIIVAAPSRGRRWPDGGGLVPVLPETVAEHLPDVGDAETAATDATVTEYFERFSGADWPDLVNVLVSRWTEKVSAGAGRHATALHLLCWGMRDARQGHYGAQAVVDLIRPRFVASLAGEPKRWPRSEFAGILAWAVAQSLADSQELVDERAARTLAKRPSAAKLGTSPADVGELTKMAGQATGQILASSSTSGNDDDPREAWIAARVEQLGAEEEARRRFRVEQRGHRPRIADGVIDDLDSIAPPAMLLGSLIPDAAIGFLAGRSGSYKTFLAVAWGCCIATRTPWLGRRDAFGVTRALKVLYVAAEGAAGAAGRVKAWEAANGLSRAGRLLLYPRPIHLNDAGQAEELAEYVADNGIEFVIIDTYHRSAPGTEENSSTDFGVVFDAVARLRDDHGCGVLFVDHTGHAGERLRGTSAKGDDADYVLTVTYDGTSRAATVPRTLTVDKLKDWESDGAWPLQLEHVDGAAFPIVRIDGPETVAGGLSEEWGDQLRWPLPEDVMTLNPPADKDGARRGRAAIPPLAMFLRHHAPAVDAVGITRAEAIRAIRATEDYSDTALRGAWSALLKAGRIVALGKASSIGHHVWIAKDDDPAALF